MFLCNEKNYSSTCFNVFYVFTQRPQNKSIVNLYQKVLPGYFSETSKCGHLIMC